MFQEVKLVRVRHRGQEQVPKLEIKLYLEDFPRDVRGRVGYQLESIIGNWRQWKGHRCLWGISSSMWGGPTPESLEQNLQCGPHGRNFKAPIWVSGNQPIRSILSWKSERGSQVLFCKRMGWVQILHLPLMSYVPFSKLSSLSLSFPIF